MNTLYSKIVRERVRFALATAENISALQHSGIKGAIREVLTADLFRPLLPADLGVATGVIISVDDKQSAQQDIIVFDRGILAPVMFENGPALIPIESALATIEVKSVLSASELRSAHENALTIRDMAIQNGSPAQTQSMVPISVLFALGSDLKATGKTETQRYEGILNGAPPLLRTICVAGKGLWSPLQAFVFDRESGQYRTATGEPFEYQWREVPGNNEHDEVLEMLALLHGAIRDVRSGRGRPPLYYYLR